MTQSMTLGWGEVKGEAVKSGLPFMKLQLNNQFRIISAPVPRYVYWVNNQEGKPRSFECLSFVRETERWDNSAKDPIKEAGLMQKGEGKDAGKMVPLRCKRAYIALAINRATGEVETLDLKKSIFDGIISTAAELGMNPGKLLQEKDIFVQKSGTSWNDTKYTVQAIKISNYKRDADTEAKDKELIDKTPDISELYPRPSYEEVKQSLHSWMSGSSNKENSEEASPSAKMAMDELEGAFDLDD